jgi:hypothetical protein
MSTGCQSKRQIVTADLGSAFRARSLRKREGLDFAGGPYNQVWGKQISQFDLLYFSIIGYIIDFLALTHGRFSIGPFFPTGMLLTYLIVGPHTENLHRTVMRLNEKVRKCWVECNLGDTMG